MRRAETLGVTILRGKEHLPVLNELLTDTMKRSAMAYPGLKRLNELYDSFNAQVEIAIAVHEGKPQGGIFIPWNLYGAYYLYGGSSDSPTIGAMNHLHWHTMLTMKARGVKIYDFFGARIHPISGSKQEGIQRFKKRFGASMKSGLLWKYPINSLKYNLLIYLRKFK